MDSSLNLSTSFRRSRPVSGDIQRGESEVSAATYRSEPIHQQKTHFLKILIKILLMIILVLLIGYFGQALFRKLKTKYRLDDRISRFEDKVYQFEEGVVDRVHRFEEKVVDTVHDIKDRIKDFPHKPYHRKTLSNCRECVDPIVLSDDFDNVLGMDSYLTEKFKQMDISSFQNPQDIPFGAIEGFVKHLQRIPELSDKINTLLKSSKSLKKELNEALEMEGKIGIIKKEYEKKLGEIEKLRSELLSEARAVQSIDKNKTELEKHLQDLADEINRQKKTLDAERLRHRKEDFEAQKLIEEELLNAGVSSPEELDIEIRRLKSQVAQQTLKNEELVAKIREDETKLKNSMKTNTDFIHRLLDLDLSVNSRLRLELIVDKIRKEQDTIYRIEEMKNVSLTEGAASIGEIISVLDDAISKFIHEKEANQNTHGISLEIKDYQKSLTKLAVLQFQNLDLVLREFKHSQSEIDREKAELRQFYSVEEIETLLSEKRKIDSEIKDILKERDEIRSRIVKTQAKMEDNEEALKETNTRLEYLLPIQTRADELIQDQLKQRDIFKGKENSFADLEKKLIMEERLLRDKTSDNEKYKTQKRQEIQRLSKRMNEKILEDPQLDEVAEKVNDYREKLREIREAYQLLQNIVNEIKSFV